MIVAAVAQVSILAGAGFASALIPDRQAPLIAIVGFMQGGVVAV